MLRRWGILLALGVALAACTNTTYSSAYYERAFTGRELDSYGAGRDFNTIVIGDPFGMGDAAFGDALRAQLIRRDAYRDINYTATPGESASNYKLVFAFNASQTVGLQTLCRDAGSVATGTRRGRRSACPARCATATSC